MADAFRIGATLEHDDCQALVVDAFLGQRRRMLASARELEPLAWEQPSRCAAWNAQQLMLHVLGATQACRTTLTGERSVFAGGFDPNSGPQAFVDQRADEPVAKTLDDLDAAIDGTRDAIEALRDRTPTPRVTAVWGAEVDWRLFVTHMFWDGWMHERDLLVPLGRPIDPTPEEARLATAYGLHSAGIMTGILGQPLDVSLELGGAGAGSYRLVVDGGDVRVTITDPADAERMGDAITVTDAIAGREPPLGDVLDAPPDVVATLGQLGTFLRG